MVKDAKSVFGTTCECKQGEYPSIVGHIEFDKPDEGQLHFSCKETAKTQSTRAWGSVEAMDATAKRHLKEYVESALHVFELALESIEVVTVERDQLEHASDDNREWMKRTQEDARLRANTARTHKSELGTEKAKAVDEESVKDEPSAAEPLEAIADKIAEVLEGERTKDVEMKVEPAISGVASDHPLQLVLDALDVMVKAQDLMFTFGATVDIEDRVDCVRRVVGEFKGVRIKLPANGCWQFTIEDDSELRKWQTRQFRGDPATADHREESTLQQAHEKREEDKHRLMEKVTTMREKLELWEKGVAAAKKVPGTEARGAAAGSGEAAGASEAAPVLTQDGVMRPALNGWLKDPPLELTLSEWSAVFAHLDSNRDFHVSSQEWAERLGVRASGLVFERFMPINRKGVLLSTFVPKFRQMVRRKTLDFATAAGWLAVAKATANEAPGATEPRVDVAPSDETAQALMPELADDDNAIHRIAAAPCCPERPAEYGISQAEVAQVFSQLSGGSQEITEQDWRTRFSLPSPGRIFSLICRSAWMSEEWWECRPYFGSNCKLRLDGLLAFFRSVDENSNRNGRVTLAELTGAVGQYARTSVELDPLVPGGQPSEAGGQKQAEGGSPPVPHQPEAGAKAPQSAAAASPQQDAPAPRARLGNIFPAFRRLVPVAAFPPLQQQRQTYLAGYLPAGGGGGIQVATVPTQLVPVGAVSPLQQHSQAYLAAYPPAGGGGGMQVATMSAGAAPQQVVVSTAAAPLGANIFAVGGGMLPTSNMPGSMPGFVSVPR